MSRKSAQTRCCACLGTNSKLNGLTEQDENKISLHIKLKLCVSEIEWLASYQICEQCAERLDISYTFRETCLKSARHLQEKQVGKEECNEVRYMVEEGKKQNHNTYKLDSMKEEELVMEEIMIKDENINEDTCDSSSNNVPYHDTHEFKLKEDECDKCDVVKDSPEDKELGTSTVCSLDGIKVQNESIDVTIYESNSENEEDNMSHHDVQEPALDNTEDKPKKRQKFDFPCEKCDKTYKMCTKLVQHCVKEHGMNKLDVRPFVCDKCPSRFNKSSDLIGHIKCHEVVQSKSSLNAREKLHLNELEYICEECGKCFKTTREKRYHKAKVHVDPKSSKYYCETCNKVFPIKSKYERHVIRHTGIKNFECYLCQRRFVDKCILRRHIKSHSDVKEHKCTHCDNEYKDLEYLKIHLAKIHGIGVDQVKFRSTERKHTCHICRKSYYRGNNLTRHLLTHSGEKPFGCPICRKKFTDKHYVKRHLRNIHKMEKLPQNISNSLGIKSKNVKTVKKSHSQI